MKISIEAVKSYIRLPGMKKVENAERKAGESKTGGTPGWETKRKKVSIRDTSQGKWAVLVAKHSPSSVV
jgi:hypothetical protein